MSTEIQSPGSREEEFARALRGRRLIFEIGLTQDTYETAALTFRSPSTGELIFGRSYLRLYPATLAVLLATAGALKYRQGELWPAIGVVGPKAAQVGQAFMDALHLLRLETFDTLMEHERALRYLTPILAHGGIPQYCLSDFFRLLVRTIRQGSTEPHEILSLWTTRKSLTQGVDKPAIRFILHGGEPALDFLQRCVDLVLETRRIGVMPSNSSLGLPQSLVDAFSEFEIEAREVVTRNTFPRPYVQLDPWDGLGPKLELPSSGGTLRVEWRVRDGRTATNYGASSFERTIRLNPARRWEIEGRMENGEPRTFIFDGFDSFPVLFFDPVSARISRQTNELRLASVLALHSRDELTLHVIDATGHEGNPPDEEELPQPVGIWSGYRLSHYRLTGARLLVATKKAGGESLQIRVVPPAERPSLDESLDPRSIRSIGGASLYSEFPKFTLPEIPDFPWEHWRITARTKADVIDTTADQLDRIGNSFSLKPILGDWLLTEIQLAIRGPLGSDLAALFAVVPGLAIERSTDLLLPDQPINIKLHKAPEIQMETCEEDGNHILCPIRLGSSTLTLQITVPRLEWALNTGRDAGVSTSSTVLWIDISEMLESADAVLVVSTGLLGVPMRLRLSSGIEILQLSEWVTTKDSGRLFFDLARFRDTISQIGGATLEFVLDFARESVTVAKLITTLKVEGIQASRIVEGNRVLLSGSFTDIRGVKQKEVRLWSLDRIWDRAIVVQLLKANSFEKDCESLVPGNYLVEVALIDPWNEPIRPRLGSPNTAEVTLGNPHELDEYRAGLNSGSPLQALELAVATGAVGRPLTEAEALAVSIEAIQTACWQLDRLGPAVLEDLSFRYIVETLGRSPATFFKSVCNAVDSGHFGTRDLLRFAIAVMPLMTAGSVVNETEWVAEVASDSTVRNLWTACPPLAAAYDSRRALAGDKESDGRRTDFLGTQLTAKIDFGGPIGNEWLFPPILLRHFYREMQVKPARPLFDIDSLAEANYEWLLAEKEGRFRSEDWVLQHWDLHKKLPVYCDTIREHLESRTPRPLFDVGMKLSKLVLGGAIHIASGSQRCEEAAKALLPLVTAVPKLLARDLTWAVVFVQATKPVKPTASMAADA